MLKFVLFWWAIMAAQYFEGVHAFKHTRLEAIFMLLLIPATFALPTVVWVSIANKRNAPRPAILVLFLLTNLGTVCAIPAFSLDLPISRLLRMAWFALMIGGFFTDLWQFRRGSP